MFTSQQANDAAHVLLTAAQEKRDAEAAHRTRRLVRMHPVLKQIAPMQRRFIFTQAKQAAYRHWTVRSIAVVAVATWVAYFVIGFKVNFPAAEPFAWASVVLLWVGMIASHLRVRVELRRLITQHMQGIRSGNDQPNA